MRIDKYLKLTRIIKRRTIAKEALDTNLIYVNDKLVKPSYNVKIGDIIKIKFGTHGVLIKVTSIKEHVKKEEVYQLFELVK